MTHTDERVGLMEGLSALPRKNGELVFDAPWEGRAFGMAVALSDQQVYQWDEFRSHLIEEITTADASNSATTYYERWLAALEALLTGRGVITPAELEVRAAEYLSGRRED
jgi:nitrile hydratase accessory protein